MATRLDVLKTYKLFIDGAFPRSESGRSLAVNGADGAVIAHLCKASRKDLRDAVEAARRGLDKWSAATAYNRGQVMYRMAEMMEGKRRELADAISAVGGKPAGKRARTAADEVAAAIDRVIYFAGWADKHAQVLGCNNPVSGPYYNFTIVEPTGVVVVVAPDRLPLLGLISLLAPVICSGNTAVVVASQTNPIPAAVFGEVCATSDVPAGVVNILTGERDELLKVVAGHRDIDAVHAAGLSAEHTTLLREGVAENIKRVTVRGGEQIDWFGDDCQSPYWIEPFVEFKTVWHPASV
ncbi:MAG: aldehyde dehydrogenase family protein [Planctomycetes bacterium]|nr:aldehyde dehydrogenase family protein [Planctomycetota bacterium]